MRPFVKLKKRKENIKENGNLIFPSIFFIMSWLSMNKTYKEDAILANNLVFLFILVFIADHT